MRDNNDCHSAVVVSPGFLQINGIDKIVRPWMSQGETPNSLGDLCESRCARDPAKAGSSKPRDLLDSDSRPNQVPMRQIGLQSPVNFQEVRLAVGQPRGQRAQVRQPRRDDDASWNAGGPGRPCRSWFGTRGPGIAPEERAKVVTRFYRLDRSRSLPGNGLGLANVTAISHLHRGRLFPRGCCSWPHRSHRSAARRGLNSSAKAAFSRAQRPEPVPTLPNGNAVET